jgi:hypothetical protein
MPDTFDWPPPELVLSNEGKGVLGQYYAGMIMTYRVVYHLDERFCELTVRLSDGREAIVCAPTESEAQVHAVSMLRAAGNV